MRKKTKKRILMRRKTRIAPEKMRKVVIIIKKHQRDILWRKQWCR
jgi:hypothetical protein